MTCFPRSTCAVQVFNYIIHPTLLASVFFVSVLGYALVCNPRQLPPPLQGGIVQPYIQNPPRVSVTTECTQCLC